MSATQAVLGSFAQAWIESRSADPAAVSALAIARSRLADGVALRSLRRMRVIELRGSQRPPALIAERLHESSQFYNPFKESCTLRSASTDAVPLNGEEVVLLVTERGAARRAGAERWWAQREHEAIEVREAVAWILAFDAEVGEAAETLANRLADLRGRGSGLLCNPHSQELRSATRRPPVPWIDGTPAP
ncbi:MAG: hypothetical protein HOP12_07735 [Candidatus Eisenbacteria bacterium]|uniref:Uncharacterized protein n=1 Tax=Eiseniibacteriota bacterium TaxID=2212470 RepID=A0A849SQ09_UNCEI|nr:hypothetical protein [Candidatus Eisenbacteria bacterium]